MPVLALLLSPRGAIGRPAFWLGLLLLAVIDLAMGLAAAPHGSRLFFAVPVLGPWFGDMDAAEAVPALNAAWGAGAAIMLVQAWISGVLCLKRLRDLGRGPGLLVLVWLLNLALHAGGRAWTARLDGPEILLPLLVALPASGLMWLAFLGWLGLTPGATARTGGAAAPAQAG